MAYFNSRVSIVKIDGTAGGALVDISPFVTEISGLPGTRSLAEITALGDTGAKFIPSLENTKITLSGIWNDSTGTTGPDLVLGVGRTVTQTLSFEYMPAGAVGNKYAGECWIESFDIGSHVGEAVKWACTLQVDGAVTRTTS